MSKKLTLSYLISNDGDGSASIHWYSSKEFADWIEQRSIENGDEKYCWGEPSGGEITLFSDSEITHNISLITPESYLVEKIIWLSYSAFYRETYIKDVKDVIKDFFAGVMPTITIERKDEYPFNKIYINGKYSHDVYIHELESSGVNIEVYLEKINSMDI